MKKIKGFQLYSRNRRHGAKVYLVRDALIKYMESINKGANVSYYQHYFKESPKQHFVPVFTKASVMKMMYEKNKNCHR
jgi:hypothetical protein